MSSRAHAAIAVATMNDAAHDSSRHDFHDFSTFTAHMRDFATLGLPSGQKAYEYYYARIRMNSRHADVQCLNHFRWRAPARS